MEVLIDSWKKIDSRGNGTLLRYSINYINYTRRWNDLKSCWLSTNLRAQIFTEFARESCVIPLKVRVAHANCASTRPMFLASLFSADDTLIVKRFAWLVLYLCSSPCTAASIIRQRRMCPPLPGRREAHEYRQEGNAGCGGGSLTSRLTMITTPSAMSLW